MKCSSPPLPDERVIPTANCSAARQAHEDLSPTRYSGSLPFRFSLSAILLFASHGEKLIRHGSGSLSWTGPIVSMLSLQQVRMGMHGAVGEIGVHHGMFAIPVFHQARVGERLLAADLFDALQHLNVDSSGHGDRWKFLRNTARFGVHRDAIDLHVGLSTRLPIQYAQPLRLFSVDGGHTESVTASDLAWAACNALDGAIILLDDWPSTAWPGVQAGAKRQWKCGTRRLTPFADVQNKLFLTTSRKHARQYIRVLLHSSFFGPRLQLSKGATVHGAPVLRVKRTQMERSTTAELIIEWHRLILEQAAASANSSLTGNTNERDAMQEATREHRWSLLGAYLWPT